MIRVSGAHSLQFCLLMGLTVVYHFSVRNSPATSSTGLLPMMIYFLDFLHVCFLSTHVLKLFTCTAFNVVSSINRLNTRGTQAQLLWAKPLVSGCYHSCIVHFIPIVGVGKRGEY